MLAKFIHTSLLKYFNAVCLLAIHGRRCGSFINLYILVEAALCTVELNKTDRDRFGWGDHNTSKHSGSDKVDLGYCSGRKENVDTIQANADC